MKKKIKLAVVDDQHLFRKGLLSLIKEFEEFDVVIEAVNGKDFVEALKKIKPDVVLLDVEMPEMDGAEVTAYLHAKHPKIKIVILTMHDDEELVFHLAKKGAHGFLLKEADIETVVDAIYTVLSGKRYFKEEISEMLLAGMAKSTGPAALPGLGEVALSEREKEILCLICKEYTTLEISERLNIGFKTVETHRERIFRKLKVRNMAGIVLYAVKHNLLD